MTKKVTDKKVTDKRALASDYIDAVARGEEGYWSACRIAHEAVTTGGYSGESFAKTVGKSNTYLNRQVRIWAEHGSTPANKRPSYTEAHAAAKGAASTEGLPDARVKSSWKSASAKAKAELAKEALKDQEVAAEVAKDDQARESFEEEVSKVRAKRDNPLKDVDARKEGRKARQNAQTQVGGSEVAITSLRQAAFFIQEALLAKEEFGAPDTDQETKTLADIDLQLRLYRAQAPITDTDRDWAGSMGVKL